MVGTIYKEMKLKPSILQEYNKVTPGTYTTCPGVMLSIPGQGRDQSQLPCAVSNDTASRLSRLLHRTTLPAHLLATSECSAQGR